MNQLKTTRVLRFMGRQKALIAISAILIAMLFFSTNFYTAYNLIDLLNSSAVMLILAFGVTLTVISGGCDLSIGGTMVLSGIVTIQLMDKLGLIPAILVAILCGMLIGFINGFFVVHQKTEPFIITLGMGMFLTGIAQELTDGRSVSSTNETFSKIANGRLIFNFTNLVLITLVIFAVMHYILRYTQFGNNCYAIGGDYDVARYSGIDVIKTKWLVYVICGGIAAIAGVLLSSKLNSGSYVYGETTALVVNCGVVVGGVSFAGGVGSMPKAALGLLVFGILSNAMYMLNIQSYVQTLCTGIVTVVIIWLDSYSRKKKKENA